MAADATRDLTIGDKTIEWVKWTWGTSAAYPRNREGADGWGTQIETAAVLQLFDMVAAGHVSAAEVRARLHEVSKAIVEEHDRHDDDPDW